MATNSGLLFAESNSPSLIYPENWTSDLTVFNNNVLLGDLNTVFNNGMLRALWMWYMGCGLRKAVSTEWSWID